MRTDASIEPAGRAIGGETSSESEVCRRLRPAIAAFAHRRLPYAAAEDFVHDVLVVLIEAMREGRVQDPERLASFSLGVCRNLARERARTVERQGHLLGQFGLTQGGLAEADPSPGLYRAKLEDCLSQLTMRARGVIRASFAEDLPDADIASTLELSEGNVRVIRHRALAALRECLERPISWVQP